MLAKTANTNGYIRVQKTPVTSLYMPCILSVNLSYTSRKGSPVGLLKGSQKLKY